MARQITASPEELLGDGRYAAKSALVAAKRDIDLEFGSGYAEKHPELVAAFVAAAVSAGSDGIYNAIFQEEMQRVAHCLSEIASALIERGVD